MSISTQALRVGVAVLGLFSTLFANGDSDLNLASALARRGWVDLAEEICGRLEKDPSTNPSVRAGVPLVLAEACAVRARREPDATRAVKELEGGMSRLARKGSSASTLEERSLLAWMMAQKARLLTGVSEEEPTYREEALRSWEAAETSYRESLAEMEKLPTTPALEEAILDARLELPKAIVAHSKVPSIDGIQRKKLLEEAVRLFIDYQFDTGARPITFEAMLEEGRCRLELEDFARGERCFRGVLAMRRDLRRLSEYQRVLLHGASVSLIRSLTMQKKPKEAIAACEQFYRENGALRQVPIGLAVALEQAEALYVLPDAVAALALLQKVAAVDPEGTLGRRARERIKEWMKGPLATPELMMLVAETSIERGLYREALANLRRCVETCTTDAERSKFEPLAAFRRGDCFQGLKRHAEAAASYQEVFRKYPKHELSPRSALEAVRGLSRESAATGAASDLQDMEKLLGEVDRLGLQGSSKGFFKFLQAEIQERKGQLKAAGDLYGEVDESFDVFADAMVSAGHCYRRDAEKRWEKGRDAPAIRDEVVKELMLAEKSLRRAVSRLEHGPEMTHPNSRLLVLAYHELATICLHETIQRTKECLDFLGRCVRILPSDSDALPRLRETEIQAHLAAKDLDAAVSKLDAMMALFPQAAPTVRTCRKVALRLEPIDPKKAWKYYRVGLENSSVPATTAELQTAADGLYRIARALNGLDDRIVSLMDLKGKPVVDPGPWRDAARLHELLIQTGELGEKDGVVAATRLAWCLGFLAESEADWSKLKTHCEGLIQQQKLLNQAGGINANVLMEKKWLAGLYFEYGHALRELGKAGQKFQLGNALRVFNNLVIVTESGSEPWWIAKYLGMKVLFERGDRTDVESVAAAISLTETLHPGFDGGKFGMKEKFHELRDEVRSVTSPRR